MRLLPRDGKHACPHQHREQYDGDAVIAHDGIKEVQHLRHQPRHARPNRPAIIDELAQVVLRIAVVRQQLRLLGPGKHCVRVLKRRIGLKRLRHAHQPAGHVPQGAKALILRQRADQNRLDLRQPRRTIAERLRQQCAGEVLGVHSGIGQKFAGIFRTIRRV